MCSVVSPSPLHKTGVFNTDHQPERRQLERRRGRRCRRRFYRRRRFGATRLMYAAQQGDVESVRRLMREQPLSLFERDRTGKSALHYCCTSDNICAAQAADLLAMAAPDLVESRDEDGFTPLHLAVIAGNTQLVTFLLANGADVEAVDNEKHTVVHWATVCGETASLRAVLAAGAPVSTPDVHGGYPLHYAAQMCGGEKDFHLGFQVLQILLSHRDIKVSVEDGDRRQPLLWAASAGSSKAMLALIRAGASVESYDKDGLTALHCAASRGHTDCIDTLLTLCGASPDVIDSNGCTALHYAVTLGHADATALLLSHGADPNRQDRKGRSPAHCGCAKGQYETLKLLASRGANLWLRNARGDLPLHEAASSGRRELVTWLLNMRPSQVNAKNNDGRTSLHMAALNDNTDMCKILLDSGAQINPVLRTSKNVFMTPLDCALQRGFRSTAKFLQLHGGLPANRLGSQSIETQRSSSVVSFPIREDMAFDTSSESADEKVEPTKSVSTRTFIRKKPKSKVKSKVTISGSESEKRKSLTEKSKPVKMSDQKTQTTSSIEEQGKDPTGRTSSRKPMSSKIDYTNEIIINGKTEVTIHQEKEITLDQEGNVISPRVHIDETITIPAQSSSGEREKRPRSAKYSKKSATTTSKVPTEKSEMGGEKVTPGKVTPESGKATPESRKPISESGKKTPESGRGTPKSGKVSFEESEVKAEVKPLKSALKISSGKTASTEKEEVAVRDITNDLSNTSEDQEESRNILVEAAVHHGPTEPITPETDRSQDSKTSQEITEPTQIETNLINTGHQQELNKDDLSSKYELTISGKDDKNKISTEGTAKTEIDNNLSPQDFIKCSDTNEEVSKDDDFFSEETKADRLKKDLDKTQIDKKSIGETTEAKDEPVVVLQESQIELTEAQSKAPKINDKVVRNDEHQTHKKEDHQVQSEVVSEIQKAGELATGVVQKIKHEIILETQKGECKEETPKSEEGDVVDVSGRSKDTSQSKKSIKISDTSLKETNLKNKIQRASKEKHEKTKSEVSEKVKIEDDIKVRKGDQVKKKTNYLTSSEDDETFISPTDYSDSLTEDKVHKSFKVLSDKKVKDWNQLKTKRKSTHSPKSKSLSRSRESKLKRSQIPTPTFATPLSKSDRQLDRIGFQGNRMESRIPSLPNINGGLNGGLSIKELQNRPDTNMSAPNLRADAYSDIERGTDSELEEQRESSPTKRKKVKRKSRLRHRESKSAGSDYESSNVIDSGFEPSPRSTRIPRWRNMSDRGVVMTSVTKSIQSNIRRYHLERKIFQHLLELKRSQIRADQHNEQVLVKRAIDQYNQSCSSTVGAGRYVPNDFTFKSFEKFLYESLRKLQKMDLAYLKGLPASHEHANPLLCTQSTHRCMHATHAYTGIPCAAYLPKMDHHSIPKIGFTTASCKPGTGGFLPKIDGKKAVTLELSHGTDKQIISLPTDRLDKNKRYYVTFTVKGHNDVEASVDNNSVMAHTHPKSD